MLNELRDLICEYVEVEESKVKEDSKFIEDLGFNSYDLMCLVGALEDKYDMEVDEKQVANLRTVKDAIRYIEAAV